MFAISLKFRCRGGAESTGDPFSSGKCTQEDRRVAVICVVPSSPPPVHKASSQVRSFSWYLINCHDVSMLYLPYVSAIGANKMDPTMPPSGYKKMESK